MSTQTATSAETAAAGQLEKVYVGRRIKGAPGQRGRCEVVVQERGDERPLPHPCTSARDCHSPDGFEWNYAGSGPSELARCILWDHLGFDPPRPLAQRFKFKFIAPAPFDGFRITAAEIARWLASVVPAEGAR